MGMQTMTIDKEIVELIRSEMRFGFTSFRAELAIELKQKLDERDERWLLELDRRESSLRADILALSEQFGVLVGTVQGLALAVELLTRRVTALEQSGPNGHG